MERKRNINFIIRNQLLGYISKEDRKRLKEWLDSSELNREQYNSLVQNTDLTNKYQQYKEVDEELAWRSFQNKHLKVKQLQWKRTIGYVAALIVLVTGITICLLKRGEEGVHTMISHETQVAMIRSERMGKQKATLVLSNGQEVKLQSSLTQPTHKSSSLPTLDKECQKETVNPQDDNKLFTYNDSEFWITLEDGTRIHLNYNTILKYPSCFTAYDRTVYLEGEAYFQVAKDSSRPFLVVTTDGTIKQYGTSFNVETCRGEGTKVVLIEGAISVISKENKGTEYDMKPGELAVLQRNKQDVQISKVDVEPYIAWNKGRFVFENCPLEKLMNVISHWYGKNIIFDSEDIKSICFTGDMDRYNSITPVVIAIRRVTGLDVKVTEKDILISKP